jgi:DNA-binding NtrC family response regulator/tetratricopeptide (TPR) repeat protein
MHVVADRFVETDRGRVVDLATGDGVVLTMASAGGPSDQLRWAARCDLLQRLHHPSLARLLDYGAVGESQRFEAWRCSGPCCAASSKESDAVIRAATSFLQACGLTTGLERESGRRRQEVHRVGARLVVRPDADAGYPRNAVGGAPPDEDEPFPLENCGILGVDRHAVSVLSELFEEPRWRQQGGAQIVGIWGPEGSGKTTLLHDLARAARLKGFVPLNVRLLTSTLADAADGRSVFLIDDERSAWPRGLLDTAMKSPRAHVVVFTSRQDIRGVAGVGLPRLSAESLAAAVRPSHVGADPRVRRAAERAEGVPGRFAYLIHGARYEPAGPRTLPRAAERAPVYGVSEGEAPPSAALAWPAPDDLNRLRQRMHAALSQLEAGRHAPGDRGLRQAIGGFARRADWAGAGAGALALGASLLKRGRARDARATLDSAREYCQRLPDENASVALATLSGVAWVDLGRLDEAENVLEAALTLARRGDNPPPPATVLALARCRFWRGQYAEADAALSDYDDAALDEPTIIRLHAMRSRIAVGRRELARAVASAVEAVQRAESLAAPALLAEAACAAGFAHLAVSDTLSLQGDVTTCLAAARTARDPLRAFRARLMLAEQFRRVGRRAEALDIVAVLKRLSSAGLPPVLRGRHNLLRDLLAANEPSADVIARHVTATGLPALALYAPREEINSALIGVVADAVAMLRVCQSAEDEGATLTAVCEHARRRLDAAAVAFFGIDRGSYLRLAGTGARLEPATAERAATAGVPVAPHRIEECVEAAVPIRYGGSVAGAMAARWTIGRSPDASRAVSLLTMSATAAAPLVASMLASRQRSAMPAGELLGVSAAMAEVRRTAERAAYAPFAVLIEGESGSGKELVARAVHRGGPRRDRPFVTLNCAALPDELVESELFGHARGAFTGAVAERVGVFEEAHSGTLMLDEVGELSLRAQAKLLRVIQEGELRRIGENVSRRIDVRIVSATNRDLRREVAAGRFRLDLLYRLDVVRIVVPALRDRRDDIPLLVEHFWREAAGRLGSRATLSAAAVAALAGYGWPGNVRELQNVLAALVVRVGRRGVVAPEALPPQFGEHCEGPSCRLEHARRVFEERFVRAALVRTGGRRAQAAAELGITRQGLTKLMTRLGIGED